MLPRLLATALTCGIVLASCGGDDEPAADPSPTPTTSTPSPTPTSTATSPAVTTPEVEKPEKPAFSKDDEGKEAFATYVVELWAYALATNNEQPLVGLSVGRKPCKGCSELIVALRQRRLEEWYVYPFEVTIRRIKLIDSALGTTASIVFDVPETRSFFEDGRVRNSSPARTGATFTVSMRQEKREYQLIGFTIDEG